MNMCPPKLSIFRRPCWLQTADGWKPLWSTLSDVSTTCSVLIRSVATQFVEEIARAVKRLCNVLRCVHVKAIGVGGRGAGGAAAPLSQFSQKY